jgi:hypothetical protein
VAAPTLDEEPLAWARDRLEATLFDGPLAQPREILVGFSPVDARGLDEAIQLAARIPPACHGSVDVRPVCELEQ